MIQLTEPDPGCWVHLSPPFNPDELEEFARRFGFDLVFLTDSLDLDERARYERDEDIRFIVASRDLIPAMADEIERLRARIEELEDALMAGIRAYVKGAKDRAALREDRP